jgi:hypothetical protein
MEGKEGKRSKIGLRDQDAPKKDEKIRKKV